MASEEPTAAAPAAEEVPAQVPAPEGADAPEASTDPAPAAEDAAASKPASKPASKKAGAPRKSATGRKPGSKPAEAATNGAEASKKFSVGDTVLGRLKGYPPWPARIVDPESVPRGVLAHRPSKSPSVYCVNYYPAGDFSWLKANEITKLSKDDITKFLSAGHRKATGGLKIAYETAQDPEEWIAKQEEMLRQREEEAENVDELEDDEDEAPTGGKRKRGAVSKPAQKKKAKKTDDEEAPKSKAKASKKGAAPVSAVENQAPVDDDPLANDPECVKVKDWRHKLQRAFLGKSLPSASEMDQYHDVFTAIESYKDMTIEALQYSKIGKVMKKIAALDAIPRNDELKLTDRAAKLMDDWHNFINTAGGDKTNGDAPKSEAPKSTGKAAAAPAADAAETKGTNGTKEETTNGTAAEEKTDEKMELEA